VNEGNLISEGGIKKGVITRSGTTCVSTYGPREWSDSARKVKEGARKKGADGLEKDLAKKRGKDGKCPV